MEKYNNFLLGSLIGRANPVSGEDPGKMSASVFNFLWRFIL